MWSLQVRISIYFKIIFTVSTSKISEIQTFCPALAVLPAAVLQNTQVNCLIYLSFVLMVWILTSRFMFCWQPSTMTESNVRSWFRAWNAGTVKVESPHLAMGMLPWHTILLYVCQFWGENTLLLFGQQNILLKNSVMGLITAMEAIWFPSSTIYPAYRVEQSS